LAFLHEAEEEVLGADVVVPELTGLFDAELEDTFRLGCERNFTEGEGLRESSEGTLDLALHSFELEPEPLEDRRGDPLSVTNQTEQDVLGSYEIVAKTACFLPGQDDDPTRPFSESFEHVSTSLSVEWGWTQVSPKPALSITLSSKTS